MDSAVTVVVIIQNIAVMFTGTYCLILHSYLIFAKNKNKI